MYSDAFEATGIFYYHFSVNLMISLILNLFSKLVNTWKSQSRKYNGLFSGQDAVIQYEKLCSLHFQISLMFCRVSCFNVYIFLFFCMLFCVLLSISWTVVRADFFLPFCICQSFCFFDAFSVFWQINLFSPLGKSCQKGYMFYRP